MDIKIMRMRAGALIPKPATMGSACFDLATVAPVELPMGVVVKIPTGLAFEIPLGYFMEIVPRSGIARMGVIIPNSPAVVDSDYRGEVSILMISFCEGIAFEKGHRIAQARIHRVEAAHFEVVKDLTPTERGASGFGSTGL